jgi:hypothetical protein
MDAIRSFLHNSDPKQGEQETRAFSLTKVLSSAAIVIGPIATLLVDKLSKINFSAGQIVALAIGLLGFLALTASADVLGRSYAAGAKNSSDAATSELKAAQAGMAQFLPFPHPVRGRQITAKEDPPIEVLASAYADKGYFLVRDGAGEFSWMEASKVTFADSGAAN